MNRRLTTSPAGMRRRLIASLKVSLAMRRVLVMGCARERRVLGRCAGFRSNPGGELREWGAAESSGAARNVSQVAALDEGHEDVFEGPLDGDQAEDAVAASRQDVGQHGGHGWVAYGQADGDGVVVDDTAEAGEDCQRVGVD